LTLEVNSRHHSFVVNFLSLANLLPMSHSSTIMKRGIGGIRIKLTPRPP
jgi:hypothetical protein